MAQLTDIDLEKKLAKKMLRAQVRLEASLRVERILNELMPRLEAEFERRVGAREPYRVSVEGDWIASEVDKALPAPADV